ncbi:hypothetical protein [Candidatus Thiosymbion oneisti]|uniref:hypothetical protein n=1 Tax=Candidatus Thiosymbion oneisti TaxID=589554 RepID=UPI0010615025|nr:hypothetical protein [Candidatus Thiosymbion oneisti]
MLLTVKLPDTLPNERMLYIIKELENILIKEGMPVEIKEEPSAEEDVWDNLDINTISVDTGIEDFAKNHDHYLYGLPKKS